MSYVDAKTVLKKCRWKDLKVITKESRDRAFGRLKKEMLSLQPSTSSGTEQEQQSKPKRRLLDFDASDESIEKEDSEEGSACQERA